MTVVVGVRCVDGVVIGADSMATSSHGAQPLMQIETNNKIKISENVIVAPTGAVGFAQRLMSHVDAAIKGSVFKNLDWREGSTNIPRRFLEDLQKTFTQSHPQVGLGFGALMAATFKDVPYLIEYATTDFQPEVRDGSLFYASMGSGQPLADPFLAFVVRVLWKGEMPTVDIGKLGVHWVLDHAIRLAPGMVGAPIHLATLRKVDGKWVAEELLDTSEGAQFVQLLEKHIAEFATGGIDAASGEKPPAPPEIRDAKDEDDEPPASG